MNLGTTEAPEEAAVRRFLLEFLSDKMVVDYPAWFWKPVLRNFVLRSRPARVAELYEMIWTDRGSPLDVGTRRITSAVDATVGDAGEVTYAYRYGEPSIRSRIKEAVVSGADRVSLVSLFPQRTGSTTGTIDKLVADLIAEETVDIPVSSQHLPPDDQGYVDGMVEVWRKALETCNFEPEHLLLSYHGIPVRYDRKEAGLYQKDCKTTTAAVLRALDWPAERATLTYQSRFGPESWIGPATDKTLEELPARGINSVAVVTPGFLTEGLETIEEIGIRGKESFVEAGGLDYVRLPCVEANRTFVKSLAKFVLSL